MFQYPQFVYYQHAQQSDMQQSDHLLVCRTTGINSLLTFFLSFLHSLHLVWKNFKNLLGKKLFLTVIKITIFIIVINIRQSIIPVILNVYFIIKAREISFVYFIGSYFMIFTLNPIPRMSQRFFIQQNIFILIMTYCCNNISLHTFCFFMLTIIIY